MAESLFTIVKDARLHEEVGRQIARRIVLGDFPVGSYLPSEAELIARFGVSRMVIREALRSLEECGMIAVRHGRRTVVLTIDPTGIAPTTTDTSRVRAASIWLTVTNRFATSASP